MVTVFGLGLPETRMRGLVTNIGQRLNALTIQVASCGLFYWET
jgi:hypothetical protein